jgi:acetylornithine/N-succinyldiaminopimelate aminotransferase
MNTSDIISLCNDYTMPNYARKHVVLVRGKGSRVWDSEGKEYLDLFPGWGVDGLGHCHPRVVDAIRDQAGKLLHVANDYYNDVQGRLAQLVSTRSFGGQCFFCNSGAEANEAAIKLSRIASPPGTFGVITTLNSFHGRTLTTVAATGQAKYQRGFEPLPTGFTHVPFGDLDAVREAAVPETCAIMVEPIQGEGGIIIAPDGYLEGLRELCDERSLFLIFDEVQTGMGRTGKMFGYQHCGVEPDIMTLAKMLGGGVAIGAAVAKKEIAAHLVPSTHASTFGGNPLAARAAIATIEAIEEEGLLENAVTMGVRIMDSLTALSRRVGGIREIRGKGLMIGAEMKFPATNLVLECLKNGLLLNCTHETVVRFLPSMCITEEEVDEALTIFDKVLAGHMKQSAK